MKLIYAFALLLFVPCFVLADQRGLGDERGIARTRGQEEFVHISGVVKEVDQGKCEKTTGYGKIGAHVMVVTDDGKTLNIHLGPVDALETLLDDLKPNAEVQVEAFRTPRMKEDHFVGKEIVVAGRTEVLRDDDLRPFWAGR